MKKKVKKPVSKVSLKNSNNLAFLILVLIIIVGVMTLVFYFSSPPEHQQKENNEIQPQLDAEGAVSLEIINPPENPENGPE